MSCWIHPVTVRFTSELYEPFTVGVRGPEVKRVTVAAYELIARTGTVEVTVNGGDYELWLGCGLKGIK